MKSFVVVTALVSTSFIATWAAPADACGATPSGLFEVELPFEGRTVPRNAVLRAPSLMGNLDGVGAATLTGPDSIVRTATWVVEGSGARLDIDNDEGGPTDLSPGPWQLDTGGRVVAFDVADETDTAAPQPELLVVRHPAPVFQEETNCGPIGDRLEILFADSSPDNDKPQIVVVTGPGIDGDLRLVAADRFIPWIDDRGGDVTVSTIDLAGNASEPVAFAADDMPIDNDNEGVSDVGLACGNCSSAPVTSTSVLAALLLLVRRRRRS